MTLGATNKNYLLDTSCFMSLDGIGRTNRFGDAERERIWKGIQSLGGRVTIITHVRTELKKNYPTGKLPDRIKSLPCKMTGLPIVSVAKRVKNILDNFPTLINVNSPHTRDPADPWIIAAAQEYGYVVVTEELKKSVRQHDKDRDHIPDVCDALGVKCITLRDFIIAENL